MALESTARHYDIFAALARDGITQTLDQGDIRILAYLGAMRAAASVGELVVGADMHPTSLFRATTRLTLAGLLHREQNAEDGRSFRYSLTKKGERVNAKVAGLVRNPPKTSLRALSKKLEQLTKEEQRSAYHPGLVKQKRKAVEDWLRDHGGGSEAEARE